MAATVRAMLGMLLVTAALAGCAAPVAPAASPGASAERECGRDGGIWRDGACTLTGAGGGY
jgi:hypothetical protein